MRSGSPAKSGVAAYLLDTNALVDWVGRVPSVRQLMRDLGFAGHTLAVCCVAVGEFYSGIAAGHRAKVDRFIDALEYWDIDLDAARFAGHYRYTYARQGIQLAVPDMLLAGLTVSRDATLITANVKDFPMPEIKLLPLPPR
jgi:predicted nucleic acid-binding protein